MARLVQLYFAIGSCVYATVVTPIVLFFLSSHGDVSKLWLLLTFTACNFLFIPIVLFMIVYTIILGNVVKKIENVSDRFVNLYIV